MPLYEYRCQDCQKKFTFLYGVVANNTEPRCPQCGSADLKKLISCVRRLRSDDEALESMADPARLGDPEDPRNLRRWARTMGRELGAETGEDLSEEFEAMLEEEEGGQAGSGEDSTIY